MDSFNSLASALNEVQNTEIVEVVPYHNTVYDIVCLKPVFATCLPLAKVEAIANLLEKVTSAHLAVTMTNNQFILDINYYGDTQHRIKGQCIKDNDTGQYSLDGDYTIESMFSNNDYELIMTFKDGLAQGASIVKDGNEIQQIMYHDGDVQERYVYILNGDSKVADIFHMDFYQFKVDLTFVERRSGDTLHVYNSSIMPVKSIKVDYDNNKNKRTTVTNHKGQLLGVIIENKYGKVTHEKRYSPNKDCHTAYSNEGINKIISTLSKSRTFSNTGLVRTIWEWELLRSVPLSLTMIKVVDDSNNTLIIYYTNTIQINADTFLGYKSYTFDCDGNKM
jgi:hypothetical protein